MARASVLERHAGALRGGEIIPADSVGEVELARMERLIEAATLASSRPCLMGPDREPIELPEALFHALIDAVAILRKGDAVSISPLHRRLSTTQAGALLGVSRQYLTRLIDAKEIPCERTGKHRRLVLGDVLDYRDRRNAARLQALDEMTAEAAASGEYD